MITILPMEDTLQKAAILAQYPNICGRGDVLEMREKDTLFGTIVVAVDGKTLCIYNMTVSGESWGSLDAMGKLTADSLLRSAASYGEHFGADVIVAEKGPFVSFLQIKGFVEENDILTAPMSAFVHWHRPAENHKA